MYPAFISCGTCENGYLRSARGMRTCSCRLQYDQGKFLYERSSESGIPEKYRRCSLTTYQVMDSRDIGAYQAVCTYEQNLTSNIPSGFGLILRGSSNSGKTHLACALAISAALKHYVVQYTLFTQYIDLVTQVWSSRNPEDVDKLKLIKTCDLLVLDDLDKVLLSNANFKQEQLDDLLRTRDGQCKSTIITTNLTSDVSFREFVGINLSRLLLRTSVPFTFVGDYTKILQDKLRQQYG